MAVQFFSQRTLARSASSRPFTARYLRSHASPACAWLIGVPKMGPSECFDVTTSLSGVSAAMKMMHPFDLSERTYGGFVCASIASHCISCQIGRK